MENGTVSPETDQKIGALGSLPDVFQTNVFRDLIADLRLKRKADTGLNAVLLQKMPSLPDCLEPFVTIWIWT